MILRKHITFVIPLSRSLEIALLPMLSRETSELVKVLRRNPSATNMARQQDINAITLTEKREPKCSW